MHPAQPSWSERHSSFDVVLRISVGGVTNEEERIRRSKVLVQAALRRLGKPRT